MKFRSKILTMIGVICISSSISAATTLKISAELKKQNIIKNGEVINKQVISYKGTTYVPLREFADLVNVDVSYDKGYIYIGEPTKEETDKLSDSYNYANPAPLNTYQTYSGKYLGNPYTIKITLTDVIRGEKAWEMAKSASWMNQEPSQGKEYLIAKVSADLVSADKVIPLSYMNFSCYSKNNIDHEKPGTLRPAPPEPALEAKLTAGGKTEGYVAFIIDKSDPSPKIGYGGIDTGVWFAASEE